jgi:hypothetical protein
MDLADLVGLAGVIERSVVVVLPASMCAMMPMLRYFASGWLRAMILTPMSESRPI